MKTGRSAPAGIDDLLDHVFQRVGHRLQQAEGAHHVGAAPHLHRGPDLAVAIDEKQQPSSRSRSPEGLRLR
jgi:hypothetical protein